MNGAQFERAFTRWLGRTRADGETRSLALRNAKYWPVGGRGNHAARLTAKNCAVGVIAHLVTERPAEAIDATQGYLELLEPENKWTLYETLTEILSDVDLCDSIDLLFINRSRPSSVIRWKNGREMRFEPQELALDGDTFGAIPGVIAYIPGQSLKWIANKIANPHDDGIWASEAGGAE